MEGDLAVSAQCTSAAAAGSVSSATQPSLGDTIDEFRDCASLMASFAAGVELRCKELRLAEQKVEEVMKEFERKKVELEKEVEAAKRKSMEVNAREEEFELLVKKEIAQRRKQTEELAAERASVEAKLKELAEREEDFVALGSYIDEKAIRAREVEEEAERKRKDLEVKEKEIELRRTGIEEQSAELKEKQGEFQVRLSELNVRERGIRDKERQCRELESNSRHCSDELVLREKEFEQRVDEFSKRELKVDLRLSELSNKEKGIDEREKGFRERFVEFEAQRVKFKESLRALEAKEREKEEKEGRFEKKLEEFGAKEVKFKEDVSRFALKKRRIEEEERQSVELELKLVDWSDDLEVREKRLRADQFSKRDLKTDSRLAELSKKERGIDEREKGFRERIVDFGAQKVKFEESLRELNVKEREIERKEVRFQKRLEELKSKEMKFKGDMSRLALKERGIEEKEMQSMELELKLVDWSDDLEVREKRLLEQEKEISEKYKVSRKMELEVQQRYDDIQTSEKQLEQKEVQSMELELKIVQRSDDLEVREKRLLEQEKAVSEKDEVSRKMELEVQQRYDDIQTSEKQLEQKEMQSMELELKLVQRSDDLEVREKILLEQEKEISEKDKVSRKMELEFQQCYDAIKTREKQLEHKLKVFKAKKVRVEQCRKKRLAQYQVDTSKYSRLKLMEKNLKDRSKMLGERIKEMELKEKQNEERREKQLKRMCRECELKDKNFSKSFSSEVKLEPLDSSMCYNPLDDSSEANIRFCLKMDGVDLQMFLNERSKDHDSMKEEVVNALKLSSDPAKLVLDAMQGFYPPPVKKGNVVFEEAVIRKSCIMLLERLTKLAPEIKPTVRKQAIILAFDWRTRMNPDAENSLEVLAFLQLLAAYGLASSFEDDDKLLAQLGVIADDSHAPTLLRDLGFTDKISMNKSTAPVDPVLMSCSDTGSIALDLQTLSGQCSRAKRSRTDACVASNQDCLDPANLPAQQSERLSSDQGCSGSLPINFDGSGEESKKSSSPLKSLFMPRCINKRNCRRLKPLRIKIMYNGLHCPEVSAALQLASDPAEFVLGVVKNPASLTLMRGDEAVRLAFPEFGPLLLLDRLWRMSPNVKPDVERDALSFAVDWKCELSKQQKKDNLDTVCFMLFIAAYKLDSSFNQEDLFSLVRTTYWCSVATLLFQTLNLKDLVTKFIEYLMRNKQPMEALRCIDVSGLLNESVSAKNLLNNYVQQCSKKLLGPETLDEEIEAIKNELLIWETIAKPIADQNLANSFREHIGFLYKQKQEKNEVKKEQKANARRCRAHNLSKQLNRQIQEAADTSSVASPTATPPPSPSSLVAISSTNNTTTASTPCSSTAPQPQEESANKRRRVVVSMDEPQSTSGSDQISDPAVQQPLQLAEGSIGHATVPCPASPETTAEADRNLHPPQQQLQIPSRFGEGSNGSAFVPWPTTPQSIPKSDQNFHPLQQEPLQVAGGSSEPGPVPSTPQSTPGPGSNGNFRPLQQQRPPLQFTGASPGAGPCPILPQQQQQRPLQFASGSFGPAAVPSAPQSAPGPGSNGNFRPLQQQHRPLQFTGVSFRPGAGPCPTPPRGTPGVNWSFHQPQQQPQQQFLQPMRGLFRPAAGPYPIAPRITPGPTWNFLPTQHHQQKP